MIKVWLDDVRKPPDALWQWVTSAPEALRVLAMGNVNCISLDHDLGNDAMGTGYTVVCEIEQWAAERKWEQVPATILVHSANPVGIEKMLAAISSINRLR